MTDDPQPDVRWAPIEPKPRNRGRVWLIVGLVAAALVIVGVLLFFLLPRGEQPVPGASGTPTPTATSTATATPVPTSTPTSEPTQTPVTTPPPPADPDIATFRGRVQQWLDDALTGLDILEESSGQDAASVVETLQADAQRLAETIPPSSIENDWTDAVSTYSARLSDLSGAPSAASIEAARSAAQDLRGLIGL